MADLKFSHLLFEFNLGFRSLKAKIEHLQKQDNLTIEGLENLKQATINLQKYVAEAMYCLTDELPDGYADKLFDIRQIHIFVEDLKREGVLDPDDNLGFIEWPLSYSVADIL